MGQTDWLRRRGRVDARHRDRGDDPIYEAPVGYGWRGLVVLAISIVAGLILGGDGGLDRLPEDHRHGAEARAYIR